MSAGPSLSGSLARLFPDGVVAAELHGWGSPALLLPEEAVGCEGFAPKRLGEFAGGRACARRALSELGHGGALPRGSDGRPVWPAGIVGSITHSDGYCAAAVASTSRVHALGLDAERGRPDPDLWPVICRPAELAWLQSLPPDARPIGATIIFSAKEAFYKCRCGVAEGWLDFHEVEIIVRWENLREAGSFQARLLGEDASSGLGGRPLGGAFRLDSELVVTGIALPSAA
jgi:4'-phosphopantetheinyl transferase EntD